jgi:diguanylate cyclase (GGDEF)-like protein
MVVGRRALPAWLFRGPPGVKHFVPEIPSTALARIRRLERQLELERELRREAEAIAETGLRKLYDSRQRLALLQRITDGANSADDIREALYFAVREICREMRWDFGNAYLVEPGGGEVAACDCWFAADAELFHDFVEVSRNARFRKGQGLPGRVLASGMPQWIDDARFEAWFVRRRLAMACGMVSACAFPIMVGTDVVAIIEFFARNLVLAKDDVVAFMGQIGTQLGRVAERERARAALMHDALHDSLTGLPNRALMRERSQAAFERLPADLSGLAMLVIDLDGFKAINDKYGHHAGDSMLVSVAARFSEAIAACADASGAHATLSRTGGDEFVVLLDGYEQVDLPQRVAAALHASLADPQHGSFDGTNLGASIGIACSDSDYHEVDKILRDADLAMYEAKAQGRGGTVIFTPDLGLTVRNRMELEREIREALRERQFVLYYQPILSFCSPATIRGYEALIRWHHPTRGLIEPSTFIPAAEESGLIMYIGEWVMREACTAMVRLHHQLAANGCAPEHMPFVAINIAPQQFLQHNFAQQVRRVLIDTGIAPTAVKLEVTEGVAIIDADRTRTLLDQFRSWGVQTGLDDFGTGYSSLSYLQNLPFDALKIDRSFIASLGDDKSRSIVRAILDLANSLDLHVIAEGVETAEQSAMLDSMGCEFGQGYLFGRPLDESTAFAAFRHPVPIPAVSVRSPVVRPPLQIAPAAVRRASSAGSRPSNPP